MTIDFRPTLAYPRLHQWPPTFGGPFLLEPCKRFRDNRDEAYLSTEQPRARTSPRFSCPQGDGWRPQDSGQPPRAGPQETVGLRAGSAPAELVRTLSKRCEFLAANRGLRFPMPGFVLLVRPRGDNEDALGIGYTVSKKVGNAVTRNRMKRRFRELARAALPGAGIAGADHVLIGRPGANEMAFAELGEHLDSALKRAAKKLAR